MYSLVRLFFLRMYLCMYMYIRRVILAMEEVVVEQLPEIHRGRSVSFKRVIFVRYMVDFVFENA